MELGKEASLNAAQIEPANIVPQLKHADFLLLCFASALAQTDDY